MPYKEITPMKSKFPSKWDFNEKKVLEGEYVRREENIGVNESTIHIIKEKTTGEEVSVWGSTVLDARLNEVAFNEIVRITYKGLIDSVKRPGKQFHSYSVEVWQDQ